MGGISQALSLNFEGASDVLQVAEELDFAFNGNILLPTEEVEERRESIFAGFLEKA